MYVCARGVISKERFEKFDWKNIYARTVLELKKEDVLFEQKFHRLRYAVSQHGNELLEWFDDNFYNVMLEPILISQNNNYRINEEDLLKCRIVLEGQIIEIEQSDCMDNIYKASLYLKNLWLK